MSYPTFFNPEESYSRSEIKALQLDRLQATVKHCMHSPFYRERFRQAGLTPADIRTLDDLRKIPFTTKQDLRDSKNACACTPPAGPRAIQRSSCIHRRTWTNGPMPSPAACGWWAAVPRTFSRTHRATECLPADSASSTAPRKWACSPSPPLPEIPCAN